MPLTAKPKPTVSSGRAPARALERQARGDGPVDIGELERLLEPVRPAGAKEQAEIVADRLLQVEPDPLAALVVTHGGDVGRPARRLRQPDRVGEAAHAPAAEPAGEADLAGFAEQLVVALDLLDDLKLVELRVVTGAVRLEGQVEQALPEHPVSLVQLQRQARRVAPGVRRIVEGPRVDDRPVHEIMTRVVGVGVGVEHVDDGKLAQGDDDMVGGLGAAELVQVGVDLLALAAEVDDLAHEQALQTVVGPGRADLVGLPAREARDPGGVGKPEALVDLGIGPELEVPARDARPRTRSGPRSHRLARPGPGSGARDRATRRPDGSARSGSSGRERPSAALRSGPSPRARRCAAWGLAAGSGSGPSSARAGAAASRTAVSRICAAASPFVLLSRRSIRAP